MDINEFIFSLLNRKFSLFSDDIENNREKLSSEIKGKNVMVIGGAGTIGSSFIKAILQFRPAKMVVVDINENGLTELVRDLRSTNDLFVPLELYTYPLSFDSSVFPKVFKTHGPFEIVANFAAHKHVRSEKDIFSIEALMENNLIKAKALLDLLIDFPPNHFFCVSTDKAANPVNIMGASKKMMEELILSYSKEFKITTARFANVAFSNGSLLEGFLKRIEKKQPLACPSDVTRFFVSPKESGEICLLACILGNTAEIFFPKLDMTKDLVNFADIVPPLLQKFDYVPLICLTEEEAKNNVNLIQQKHYPVHLFKSNTSGEKLYEEFYTEDEEYNLNKFTGMGVLSKQPVYSKNEFNILFGELEQLFSNPVTTKSDIVSWLKKYIPEFEHIEKGQGLDNKM